MNENIVPGISVEATNRHFVELKWTGNKIYNFWHKVHYMSEQSHNPRATEEPRAGLKHGCLRSWKVLGEIMIDRLKELQTDMIDREEVVPTAYSTNNNFINIKSANWIVRSIKFKIIRLSVSRRPDPGYDIIAVSNGNYWTLDAPVNRCKRLSIG